LLLCLWVCFPEAALGDLPIPPMRGVTPDEFFAHSVAAADAIVLATVEEAQLTRVKALSTDSTSNTSVPEWQLEIRQWLKGGESGRPPSITVGHNRLVRTPPRLRTVDRKEVLLIFLNRPPMPPRPGMTSRVGVSPHWDYLIDVRSGVRPVQPSDASDVARVLKSQTPSQMARRASAIVEGVPDRDNQQVCAPFGEPTACTPLVVRSVLKGLVTADTLAIYSKIPFYYKSHVPTIVFLSHTGENMYEIVAGPAGTVSFDDGIVDKHGKALVQWRAELRDFNNQIEGGVIPIWRK